MVALRHLGLLIGTYAPSYVRRAISIAYRSTASTCIQHAVEMYIYCVWCNIETKVVLKCHLDVNRVFQLGPGSHSVEFQRKSPVLVGSDRRERLTGSFIGDKREEVYPKEKQREPGHCREGRRGRNPTYHLKEQRGDGYIH